MEISTSFTESRNDMKLEESGIYDIISDTKFNDYSGIFVEGGNLNDNKEALLVSFGDDNFSTIIYSQTEYNDIDGRLELIKILKSVVYDKEIKLNELELANFTFDNDITKFKHSMTMTNIYMFSENGKDDSRKEYSNSIILGNLPKMNKNELKLYTEDLIRKHQSKGIGLISPQLKEMKVGSYEALVLDSKITDKGKNGLIYQVVLSNGEKSVMFMGTAYSNKIDLKDKYIKTVESIRIK